jgi:hypothetical protein
MRTKVTVRAKRARVNSVFLVQLRKKVRTDFRGSRGSRESFSDISFLNGWRQFRIDEAARKKSGTVGSRIVHSVCTGNAERQFSILVVGR